MYKSPVSNSSDGFGFTIAVALLAAVISVPFVACQDCTDAQKTRRVLEAQGFTNISTGDYAHWACGGGDVYRTPFKATNNLDKRVEGVVCCGIWKNCTVRCN